MKGTAQHGDLVNARWNQVGVTTAPGFGTYWSLSGLFNGNQTDRGVSPSTGVSQRVVDGAVLGVALDINGDTVTVTFFRDGCCLGPGLRTTCADPSAAIYPVVSAGHTGDTFSIRVFQRVPALQEGQGADRVASTSANRFLLRGQWTCAHRDVATLCCARDSLGALGAAEVDAELGGSETN